MISVIIRNKNEGVALNDVLQVLEDYYKDDVKEIILVDNESTDDSLKIAASFNVKVITIKNFTYGKAINLGIENASQPYVLLLSSHSYPIGTSFFKTSIQTLESNNKIAGLRYINTFQNYKRAITNNFEVKKPLEFGLMAACAMVRKSAWEEVKFDEELIASEDKLWSSEISNLGFLIKEVRETYFYFIKRTEQGSFNRWKNEYIVDHILLNKTPLSKFKAVFIFIKSLTLDSCKKYASRAQKSFKTLKVRWNLQSSINSYKTK